MRAASEVAFQAPIVNVLVHLIFEILYLKDVRSKVFGKICIDARRNRRDLMFFNCISGNYNII